MTGFQPVHTLFQISITAKQMSALVPGIGLLNSAGECLKRKNDQQESNQRVGRPGLPYDWLLDYGQRWI